MSLFDFLFPDQAQASHLRRLADSTARSGTQARIAQSRIERGQVSSDKRVQELEAEVAQLSIVIEALLEKLGEAGVATRDEIAAKVGEIDARDGVIDGRVTKHEEAPPSPPAPKFRFPDQG